MRSCPTAASRWSRTASRRSASSPNRARYDALRVGPALDDLDLGPLISRRQQAVVEGFLARGEDLRVAGRGRIVDDAPAGGSSVAPVLLAEVDAAIDQAQVKAVAAKYIPI